MGHGSQGLFTQVGFNDPLQDDSTQSHFGVANANPLQSQVFVVLTFLLQVIWYCDCFAVCHSRLNYSTPLFFPLVNSVGSLYRWILSTPSLLLTTTHSRLTCRLHNSSLRLRTPKIRKSTITVEELWELIVALMGYSLCNQQLGLCLSFVLTFARDIRRIALG